ncbi:hypothetical protein ACFOQM_09640 [Paenibacillus sp. GCM10012307]
MNTRRPNRHLGATDAGELSGVWWVDGSAGQGARGSSGPTNGREHLPQRRSAPLDLQAGCSIVEKAGSEQKGPRLPTSGRKASL